MALANSTKVNIETLTERIIWNVRDSRLVKLINFVREFTIAAEIKLNGRPLGGLVTILIFILGVAMTVKLAFKRVLRPLIYPALRKLFFRFLRRKSRLLPYADA